MKKSSLLILSLALAATASSQEVFDLLRKGEVAAVKALIDKTPQLVDARDGESHAYWVSAKILNVLKANALER